MSKLYRKANKKVRHDVYTRMLNIYNRMIHSQEMRFVGLCFLLDVSIRYEPFIISSDIEDYPELIKHKPVLYLLNGSYWFITFTREGIEKRIAILEQAIEETKRKKNISFN